MTPPVPTRLNLKKDEKLEIDWADGRKSVYTIGYLRSMCPCAQCKQMRAEEKNRKSLLRVLPGNHSKPLAAVKAELVGELCSADRLARTSMGRGFIRLNI